MGPTSCAWQGSSPQATEQRRASGAAAQGEGQLPILWDSWHHWLSEVQQWPQASQRGRSGVSVRPKVQRYGGWVGGDGPLGDASHLRAFWVSRCRITKPLLYTLWNFSTKPGGSATCFRFCTAQRNVCFPQRSSWCAICMQVWLLLVTFVYCTPST